MRTVPFLVTEIRRRKNPARGAPRYRVSLVRETGSVYVTSKPIVMASQVFDISKGLFEGADREEFYVLCLDMKSKIIGINLVSIGTVSASLVHPREVFKAAILLNATSVIAVHNHPSGDPAPSLQDHQLTHRLIEAGMLMGIDLKDHVVCGEGQYFSYGAQGLIETWTREVTQ